MEIMEKISYKNIRLLPHNPRYTLASEIDLLNINFEDNYNLEQVILELLKHEDDWNDFYDLIEQLELGYNPAMDQIFVVEGSDNFLYVVEGNRRIMTMTIMKEFKKYENLLKKFDNVTNFDKVLSKLRSIDNNDINFNELLVTKIENIKDEDDIWKIIYTRHAGENKGKRSWSRLKYFYDLKDAFFNYKNLNPNVNVKVIKEKLSYRFNKSKSSLDTDLNSSLWLTDMIDNYNRIEIDNDKIEITENNDYTSALELSRSNIKIEYDNEIKSLNKLFNITLDINKWEVTVNKITKKDFYIFLIKNVKQKNFTTRGWKDGDSWYILYDFIDKYLNFNNKDLSIRNEIELAKNIPEDKRNKLQKEYIEYQKNLKNLKELQTELLNTNNLKINDEIKIGLKIMWENNAKPLFDILKTKSKNYPFLISSILIRSSIELLSFYSICNSKKLLNKINEIWDNLNENERKEWNKPYQFPNDKLKKMKDENIKNKIYKEYETHNIYEILKKFISKNKISSKEILEFLYDDNNFDRKNEKYKKLQTQIGYIDKMIEGKNLQIPNKIIHTYYYLNDSNNLEIAWESLNTQLQILTSIIRIWLLE